MKVLVSNLREDIWDCDKIYRFYKDALSAFKIIKFDHLYLDSYLGMCETGYFLLCELEVDNNIPYMVTPINEKCAGRTLIIKRLERNGYVKNGDTWYKI